MCSRFLDEDYEEANKIIASIQSDMVEYFSKRDTDLSKKGLHALKESMAGIYYIPFQVGKRTCFCEMRFSL